MDTPKTARYISKYRNLTIAVKSAYYKTVEDKRILVDGKRVNFTEGFFETNDENLVKELESRADFGTAFVRIPENKTVDQMREKMKAVDEKERELAAREAELDAREKKIKAAEEGGDLEDGNADLEEMNRKELVETAEALGLPPETWKVGTKNVDIAEAIKAKRAETADEAGSFDE